MACPKASSSSRSWVMTKTVLSTTTSEMPLVTLVAVPYRATLSVRRECRYRSLLVMRNSTLCKNPKWEMSCWKWSQFTRASSVPLPRDHRARPIMWARLAQWLSEVPELGSAHAFSAPPARSPRAAYRVGKVGAMVK